MAKRPTHTKKINRLRKALRATPPAYIDLVQYLRDRGHAQTNSSAEEIIAAGRVRVGSHKLTMRLVPATRRSEIVVLDA